jgi:hypothetical protein
MPDTTAPSTGSTSSSGSLVIALLALVLISVAFVLGTPGRLLLVGGALGRTTRRVAGDAWSTSRAPRRGSE